MFFQKLSYLKSHHVDCLELEQVFRVLINLILSQVTIFVSGVLNAYS